jgi:hypothetical protein
MLPNIQFIQFDLSTFEGAEQTFPTLPQLLDVLPQLDTIPVIVD